MIDRITGGTASLEDLLAKNPTAKQVLRMTLSLGLTAIDDKKDPAVLSTTFSDLDQIGAYVQGRWPKQQDFLGALGEIEPDLRNDYNSFVASLYKSLHISSEAPLISPSPK